ncbi:MULTISPECIES: alpha-ketoglutarate-dependent dioxygenase AlkB [unclassified Massilia]|uniref:alpha-ketoglutarate-dependent dioxygenase AlkB family protein n=1 Tax=unclassified Massilia TaxID=2609279 RepID=UPI00177AA106|nr:MULTISPECIES: alpha-ketoglutarate-dependent dioxygenase AlkB [unclassified Massilia]MBD8531404.1 alpha-ketoglutarate-dependent dioxygenase AlkB [Massilia sp. CFBP 13647]MBD8674342.1 alpha-ketoglutarate-dependent dioxygenase AlkB [Massilia sp. CFBP 13721]
MDLFDTPGTLVPIPIMDGELALLPQLALPLSNAAILARLLAETPWRAESVVVYGKRHLQPRLTAWYGDASYTYSGLRLEPLPWTALLLELRAAVEAACGHRFNSVLLNRYRNERDSMGMHSDDEAELGDDPVIASLSYGTARTFVLRHKNNKQTVRLPLEDGSLLLMSGQLQKHWLHGINKSTRSLGERVNCTFRYIV